MLNSFAGLVTSKRFIYLMAFIYKLTIENLLEHLFDSKVSESFHSESFHSPILYGAFFLIIAFCFEHVFMKICLYFLYEGISNLFEVMTPSHEFNSVQKDIIIIS